MSLRGPKINNGIQTLPRPSRKGNLANAVAPKPVNKDRANGCRIRREKEKREKTRVSTEEQTPWHVLCEARTRLCSPGYIVDLAATKELETHTTISV
jgi:hypothetical protein